MLPELFCVNSGKFDTQKPCFHGAYILIEEIQNNQVNKTNVQINNTTSGRGKC